MRVGFPYGPINRSPQGRVSFAYLDIRTSAERTARPGRIVSLRQARRVQVDSIAKHAINAPVSTHPRLLDVSIRDVGFSDSSFSRQRERDCVARGADEEFIDMCPFGRDSAPWRVI